MCDVKFSVFTSFVVLFVYGNKKIYNFISNMGRKIPGRKHRGVKDPEKQALERLNKIKDKINAPPANPDDQQIPHSLQRIIDLKNKVKSGEFNKKKLKKDGVKIEKPKKFRGRPEKPIPIFKQKPGETERAFKQRMNRICMSVTREAKFEDKYGVDIQRNESGEVEKVVKRPKDELDILLKKARKEKEEKKDAKKKKKKKKDEGPRLTKSQKWSLKKKQKLLKKKSKNYDEFKDFKDEVKFGETVHAPPVLVAPRKVEKTQVAARPGMKSLLLKSMMHTGLNKNQKGAPQIESTLHKINNKNGSINKKGKRKDLPNALRRQLEGQQKEVITAYKALKADRYKN